MARQFLDVEAEVDDDIDEEDHDQASVCNDLEDAFIDDDSESNVANTRYLMDFAPDEAEKALEDLFTRILNNSVQSSCGSRPGQRFSIETERSFGLHPQETDYPLWKVGVEDLAVLSLMSTVQDRHQVRSAFTRGSIRGSIYVEGTMNRDLLKLLKSTPGVIHGYLGIRRTMVDPSEYRDILTMKNNAIDVEVGDWVVVKKGLYRGDVALVTKTTSWGARLLLVPRIGPSPGDHKRKRSTLKPTAELFDPTGFQPRVVHREDVGYSLGMLDFQQGLLVKIFGYHSFEKGTRDIPYELYTRFRHSKHPDLVLSRMPRPREWCMKEHDAVVILSSGELGTLKSLHTTHAEVERTKSDEPSGAPVLQWTERVPWYDIQKSINIGQYVRVNSGPHLGKSGWVVSTCSEIATFATKKWEGSITNKEDPIELFDVLINFLETVDPPFTFSENQNLESIHFEKRHRHPWCGANILISKKHHPRKGEIGEIQEVIDQEDGSVVRLYVQLTRYNPSVPFQNITIDEIDVVELSTLKPLAQYLDPNSQPRPHPYPSFSIYARTPDSIYARPPDDISSGIPMPSSLRNAEAPAWDPSSRTPTPYWEYLSDPFPTSFVQGSSSTCSLPLPTPTTTSISQKLHAATPIFNASQDRQQLTETTPGQILLNAKLLGAKLNVIVNGGEFTNKELVAMVSLSEDRITLRHTRYHTSILLDPVWVTPKYPNPTHDNGLLVVIEGDHCGKYVRRICHRRVGGSTSIVLAVVTRSENLADVVTGERLELNIKCLCTITESKKEKDLNRGVMETIRKEYRSRPS